MRIPHLCTLVALALSMSGCLSENDGRKLPSSEDGGEAGEDGEAGEQAGEAGEGGEVAEGEGEGAQGEGAEGEGAEGEGAEGEGAEGEGAEGEGAEGEGAEGEGAEGEGAEGEGAEGEGAEGEGAEGEGAEGEGAEGEGAEGEGAEGEGAEGEGGGEGEGEGEGGEGEGEEGEGEEGGEQVEECARDEDCLELGGPPICDPEGNVCVQCLRDAECPVEHLCVDKACERGCRDGRDCADGRHCSQDAGGCVDCVEDAHCPDNHSCSDNECVFRCDADEDCPEGVCDADSGLCIDCRRDADCALGTICEDSECVPGCHDDRDCVAGVCSDGECVECERDNDCPQQPGALGVTVCDDQVCRAGACRADEHCPEPFICRVEEGECARCDDDDECGGARICVDELCVERCGDEDVDQCNNPDRPFCIDPGEDGYCAPCRDGECVCIEADNGREFEGMICGEECVEVLSDPAHCGVCGNGCEQGAGCFDGRCGQLEEREPNNDLDHCQPIPHGAWRVEGVINPNRDRDWWCFVAEAGQQVLFNVDARILRSGLDSYLYLHEITREGPQLIAENDDERLGQLQDSWLEFEFEHAGQYAIEVGAWSERGCGNCFYVLNIETE